MNTNNLNTALYEKMATEQEKYRDWLKSQPPEEVLNHAYEYTIREDIVMAMEELELTDTQAQALLESPSPLADVYRYFEKLETGYMDVIRDSIENRADDVCRAKEELRTTPIYPHSAAYAREHGELEQYRASNNVNRQCKESIEAAVREHFDGMYLSLDCQHFFRQIFLGYFSDIVQAFDTLRKNVCGDDYTSLHNPIVLSSVLPAYGMFHSIQILFL